MVWMLGAVVTAALLTTLCSACFVDKLVFHPTSGMQAPLESYDDVEQLTLTTEDGVGINTFYLRLAPESPTILFFHGNAGNASHRLDDADRMRSLGANVLLVDYRGFGLSEGRPSESGVYRDAEAALTYLIEKQRQPMDRILIYGRSLGSAVAVHLALERRLGGVILVSPFTSGKDMAPFYLKPNAGGMFDTMTKLAKLRAPLLIIHGDEDSMIPVEMGQLLFDSANGEKDFVVIRGAGHNDLIQVNSQRFFSAIGAFLKKNASNR
jgi:pimeloyl-ACP methyl ester carboxylesterase